MPWISVAPTTRKMIPGNSDISPCGAITLSTRGRNDSGSTKEEPRLITINRKLTASSFQRGLIRFQTAGHTFFKLGFGRAAVIAVVVAFPTPREGRSPRRHPSAKARRTERWSHTNLSTFSNEACHSGAARISAVVFVLTRNSKLNNSKLMNHLYPTIKPPTAPVEPQ